MLGQLKVVNENETLNWENYSRLKVENALRKKQPVFIDWTAKWCITCMVNKKNALQSETMKNLVKEKNILLLRADITNYSAALNKALNFYKRASVPLYVYYDGKSDDYLLLPQILTTKTLEEYIR